MWDFENIRHTYSAWLLSSLRFTNDWKTERLSNFGNKQGFQRTSK